MGTRNIVLHMLEAVEGARGRRRCALYAEVARLAKRFLPDGSDTRKQSLARHLQKLTKAGQTSFAKGVLQQHQIRFLIRMNDESKVRWSTTSVILGKAKAMSYEDLEEARAKRAEKDAAKEANGKGKRGRKPKSTMSEAETSADKGNHGRKRKSTAPEADAPEPKAKKARMIESPELWKAPVSRMSEAQVEDEIVPEPTRASVMRMSEMQKCRMQKMELMHEGWSLHRFEAGSRGP